MSNSDLDPRTVSALGGVPHIRAGAPDRSASPDDAALRARCFHWARALRLFLRRLLITASFRRWLAIRRHALTATYTDPEAEDTYRDAIRCRMAIAIAGQGGDPATVFELLAHRR